MVIALCVLQVCVTGMLELKDFTAFKQHLRDFLVQSKSFVDKDNQELFAEEAAARQMVRAFLHLCYASICGCISGRGDVVHT
jgi:hypothetical protein